MRIHTALLALLVLLLAVARPTAAQAPLHALRPDDYWSNFKFGTAIGDAGDVDGDGVRDLVISAPGRVAIYVFGGADGAELQMIENQTGSSFLFGEVMDVLGDVNGDGRRDLLVGNYRATVAGVSFAGAAYALDGGTGAVLYTVTSPAPQANSYFGRAADVVGDVDGDGASDFAVAARFEQGGRVHLFNGLTGAFIRTLTPVGGNNFGAALAGIGDVDGDTVRDVAVAEYGTGSVHLYSAATGTYVRTLAPTASGLLRAVADAGDVDGDGRGDVAAAAGDDAWAYVFSGATGAVMRTLQPPPDHPGSVFNNTVAGVGDMDGDGVPDVAAEGAGGTAGVGYVAFYSGASGAPFHVLEHPAGGNGFGGPLVLLPDVDGDGRADFAIGAPGESGPCGSSSCPGTGRTYVYSGATLTAAEPGAPAPPLALRVAPQPVRGAGTLTLSLRSHALVRVTLHDALGREVAVLADGSFAPGTHALPLDVARLPPGVYVARAQVAGQGPLTARVVVVR